MTQAELETMREDLLNRYEVLTPSRSVQNEIIQQAADADDKEAENYIIRVRGLP